MHAVDRVRRQDRLQSEWSPVVAIGRDGDDERDLCAAEVSRRRQLVRAMYSGDSLSLDRCVVVALHVSLGNTLCLSNPGCISLNFVLFSDLAVLSGLQLRLLPAMLNAERLILTLLTLLTLLLHSRATGN